MKKIIQFKLKILAKLILKKYKPEIIGITGSVGKTSAKEAIYTVLSSKFKVRRNIKNYNNEIGLPLTIIGEESPGKFLLGWLYVFWKAFLLIIFKNKNYPKILILEMGIDRPGDMKYFNSFLKCYIGVITLIGPVHLEYFGAIENIQKEKGGLIKNLKESGWAILNFDDERIKEISDMTKAKIMTYGFKEKADLRAQELFFSFEKEKDISSLRGINFKLNFKGSFVPVLLPNIIGYSAIYAALAGAAVGIIYEMNLVEISEALKKFNSIKGRMNLIAGIKNTMLVDDTYNASPQSCILGLEVIEKIPLNKENKKITVFGDMFELGSYSEEGHREVGRIAKKTSIDKLIVVGERSRDIAKGAKEAGMNEDNVFHFEETREAGKFIQEMIKEGDLIYIKGSRGMRMENVVEELMAEPMRADELLIR